MKNNKIMDKESIEPFQDVKCKNCNWVGKENELEEYTFDDDRYSEFYCPECDTKYNFDE